MKLEHLEYFISLKDARSLSEAAAHAHITQQGYGKIIASLENSLGVKLVDRSARGAELTEAGLAFMPHAEAIVAEFHAAETGLRLQRKDIETLVQFQGNIAFSNVCTVTFEKLISGSNLLSNANKSELPLDVLLHMVDDPNWICLGDICTQLYPDYESKWNIKQLGVGRVGVIVPRKYLQNINLSDAATIAQYLPLGVFDCYASREIYNSLVGALDYKNIKLRTTSDKLLMEGLERGDFAVLSDSLQWELFGSRERLDKNAYLFIPFQVERTSIFGFIRKKGIPYSAEQQKVIESFSRMYENVGKR